MGAKSKKKRKPNIKQATNNLEKVEVKKAENTPKKEIKVLGKDSNIHPLWYVACFIFLVVAIYAYNHVNH